MDTSKGNYVYTKQILRRGITGRGLDGHERDLFAFRKALRKRGKESPDAGQRTGEEMQGDDSAGIFVKGVISGKNWAVGIEVARNPGAPGNRNGKGGRWVANKCPQDRGRKLLYGGYLRKTEGGKNSRSEHPPQIGVLRGKKEKRRHKPQKLSKPEW